MNKLWDEFLGMVRSRPKLFGWLTAIAVVVMGIDFFARGYVPRDEELRKFSAPGVSFIPKRVAADTIRARLLAVLPDPRPPEAEKPKPREIALQGIFASRGSRTAALVLLPQGDQPLERRNLQVASEIDGWVIERISGTSVTLKKGSEVKELVMFRGKTE